ncbi:RadP cytochrome P450 epoxidase [Colletotrichum graminicola M1.001]|uniref:RadP cytochrome P450 epoxidase n=1 Tax=Colletotrichum graminicola (strain M1.001 / M2 / FGSC 10212) TaxID=645133 RepID=E3QK78_COLGM|nr:RadP cytochrome P450 epoxidase [Colletotrichum graminicola M1.001]EFQ31266.1 RadP cytochrome P450 epoxidase [Colletotrichum graminicola M1.001]
MKNGLGDGSESILTASDEDHRRMRKIFTPAFSEKGIRSREGMLKKYTDLFVQKSGEWFDQNGKVDMYMFSNFALLPLILPRILSLAKLFAFWRGWSTNLS